jgi:hypothetical protein
MSCRVRDSSSREGIEFRSGGPTDMQARPVWEKDLFEPCYSSLKLSSLFSVLLDGTVVVVVVIVSFCSKPVMINK